MSTMRNLFSSRTKTSLNRAYSSGPHHVLKSMTCLAIVASGEPCLLGRRGGA